MIDAIAWKFQTRLMVFAKLTCAFVTDVNSELQDSSTRLQCTTDPAELVAWTRDLQPVTVFATYAAVGLGILQRSHEAGLAV